jgi:hypothetical protein
LSRLVVVPRAVSVELAPPLATSHLNPLQPTLKAYSPRMRERPFFAGVRGANIGPGGESRVWGHLKSLKAVHASGLFRRLCPCLTLLFRLKAGEGADNGFGLGCYSCDSIDATVHQDGPGGAIGQRVRNEKYGPQIRPAKLALPGRPRPRRGERGPVKVTKSLG